MYDKFLKKYQEFKSCCEDPQIREWIETSDISNWICSIYRIKGRKISKDNIISMVCGNLKDDIALSDYAFAKSLRDTYCDMKCYLSMQAVLDTRMLKRWGDLMEIERRDNNRVVYEWDLIPPHFRAIDEEMAAVLSKASPESDVKSYLKSVSFLHMEINRIYPCGEDTVFISTAALIYSLLGVGLLVPEFSANDIEYNQIVAKYVENGDVSLFEDMLIRSLYNRLDEALHFAKNFKVSQQEI